MKRTAEILAAFRRMGRLYDQLLRRACRSWGLNQLEATIISFLHNNPGLDTAGDIAELRKLPKGNVSQGVEALIGRGLLLRRPDPRDRRKIRLSLTPAADPIVARIADCQRQFFEELFRDFTPEERAAYSAYMDRMMKNAETALERMDLL